MAKLSGPTTEFEGESQTDGQREDNVSALRSLTFSNLPKDNEPDILCEFLLEIGACSAAITDFDAGTDMEDPIFREPPTTSSMADTAWWDSLHWASPVWN